MVEPISPREIRKGLSRMYPTTYPSENRAYARAIIASETYLNIAKRLESVGFEIETVLQGRSFRSPQDPGNPEVYIHIVGRGCLRPPAIDDIPKIQELERFNLKGNKNPNLIYRVFEGLDAETNGRVNVYLTPTAKSVLKSDSYLNLIKKNKDLNREEYFTCTEEIK